MDNTQVIKNGTEKGSEKAIETFLDDVLNKAEKYKKQIKGLIFNLSNFQEQLKAYETMLSKEIDSAKKEKGADFPEGIETNKKKYWFFSKTAITRRGLTMLLVDKGRKKVIAENEEDVLINRAYLEGKTQTIFDNIQDITFKNMQKNERIKNIFNKQLKKITNTLINAYSLIHEIRENFTGQQIDYEIFYNAGNKNNKVIARGKIKLENIKRFFYLSIGTNGLVLSISQTTDLIKELESWQKLTQKQQEIYNSFRRKRKGNAGNSAEATSVALDLPEGGKNISRYRMNKIYTETLANNISFIQGGDKGNTQIKNVENASATVAKMGTLIQGLKDLQKAFDLTNREEIKKELIKIFFPKSVVEKVKENIDADVKEIVSKKMLPNKK